jgi:P-type Cu+ transporter
LNLKKHPPWYTLRGYRYKEKHMEQVSFKVMKMGCSACVAKVTKALSNLPGVEVVNVTPGLAVVNRDPRTADDTAVIAALKGAGYEASRGVTS